jgi:hypothetical protein
VLPLTHVKSLLFGSSLISNAFGVHGGPIAADAESLRLLEGEAVRLMDALGVPVLELRGFSDTRADWPTRSDLYVNFTRPIDPSIERNLKLIPRKQRAMIRKAQGNQLRSEIDTETDRLYDIYAESVRNLGTPVFGKNYFYILREEFSIVGHPNDNERWVRRSVRAQLLFPRPSAALLWRRTTRRTSARRQ